MALSFARSAQARGHPVTVFLNVNAVRLAARTAAPKDADAGTLAGRSHLKAILADGGTVIVCPMCLDIAGTPEDRLIAGVQVGRPELTQEKLFAEDVRVMSY
jgi:predicted peroxiredoxin